jgi:hypothetical protein
LARKAATERSLTSLVDMPLAMSLMSSGRLRWPVA